MVVRDTYYRLPRYSLAKQIAITKELIKEEGFPPGEKIPHSPSWPSEIQPTGEKEKISPFLQELDLLSSSFSSSVLHSQERSSSFFGDGVVPKASSWPNWRSEGGARKEERIIERTAPFSSFLVLYFPAKKLRGEKGGEESAAVA